MSTDGNRASDGLGQTPEKLVQEISIALLAPDPFQPRNTFPEANIRELAESIHQHGLLQPLLVRPMQGPNSAGKYWIVAGERRYRAAQLLGLENLPCRVQHYENMAAAVVALAENVHRQDLNEIDKAAALLRIKNLTERTWDEVAELVKLSRDYVKRLAGLLKLEESVKQRVRSGELPVRTAIALRPLSAARQVEMVHRILKEGLTAEEVRAEVNRQKRQPAFRRQPDGDALAEGAVSEVQADGLRGPVLANLQRALEAVEQIDGWLESREWNASRVTERQAERLDALCQAVGHLHQHLLAARVPAVDAALSDAERLRKLEPPF